MESIHQPVKPTNKKRGKRMPSDDISRKVIETVRVQSLVSKSIIARDSGHWVRVAECYHPQATLTTSWFTGTPAEFVDGSQNMKMLAVPARSYS